MSIEEKINYTFKNKEFLKQALIHPSMCESFGKNKLESNQRLEFLGDAVIELIFTDYLYIGYPQSDEGELTKMRAQLVSKKTLSSIAGNLQLSEYLVLSEGARKMKDHQQESTLCDSFESLVAAVYLDSSYDKVKEIFRPLVMPFIMNSSQWSKGNPKNLVQEYVQKYYQNLPEYRLNQVTGEAHNPFYIIELYINNEYKSTGQGKSKKRAEFEAADKFLELIQKEL